MSGEVLSDCTSPKRENILFPQLYQFPARSSGGILCVVGIASDLTPEAVCHKIGGEGIVQLAGEHAAPILDQVKVVRVHGDH